MQKNWIAMMGTSVLILIVLVAAPAQAPISGRTSVSIHAPLGVHAVGTAAGLTTALAPVPLTTFPRTVLIEAFTGVWCPHCPAESQSLHYIDDATPAGVISVPELHVCAFAPGAGPCLDNYVPPDNTTNIRGAFYNVCGFPHVFFDGTHSVCGATDYVSQMQPEYQGLINNASAIPGNVSISQTALVTSTGMSDSASILSGVTGTYNAVTYLMEYIDKQNVSNGNGPHDVDRVVRATLYNHPVNLVAGQTTQISSQGALESSWNQLNLSVVTFVQQNSTKIVQNANQVPVTTLTTAVSSNLTTLVSSTSSTITVRIANSSTGVSIAGATVNLSADLGGTFQPASGTTASDGSFTSIYTAPSVATSQNAVVTATVTAAGYTKGSGTTSLVVTPIVLPLAPTGLSALGGNSSVTLNWTAPTTGGAGLTYYVYRSTTPTGVYAQIGTSTTPLYVDTNLVGGQSYWYKINARNAFGFSGNTTVTPITGLTATASGLPANVGWWLSIDSMKFSSETNDALYAFLPSGFYQYTFGPSTYAYLASGGSGTLSTAGVSVAITASFSPRYASLQGTVTPATANAAVLLNGTAISVADGSFNAVMVAGTYSLSVSAPGYDDNNTTVTLTPGNLTTVDVLLNAQSGSGGSSTSALGGLSTVDALIIIAGVIAVVALVSAALVMSSGRRKHPPRRRAPPPPETE